MKIETDTEVLPAFLASALINGDFSSFDDEGRDMRIYDAVVKYLGDFRVVGCGDETWFAPFEFFGISGEVCEYQLIREVEAEPDFHCLLCGQHITDGKPCDCGAR